MGIILVMLCSWDDLWWKRGYFFATQLWSIGPLEWCRPRRSPFDTRTNLASDLHYLHGHLGAVASIAVIKWQRTWEKSERCDRLGVTSVLNLSPAIELYTIEIANKRLSVKKLRGWRLLPRIQLSKSCPHHGEATSNCCYWHHYIVIEAWLCNTQTCYICWI